MTRDPEDLVGERERLLLEADAIARLRGESRRVRRCVSAITATVALLIRRA